MLFVHTVANYVLTFSVTYTYMPHVMLFIKLHLYVESSTPDWKKVQRLVTSAGDIAGFVEPTPIPLAAKFHPPAVEEQFYSAHALVTKQQALKSSCIVLLKNIRFCLNFSPFFFHFSKQTTFILLNFFTQCFVKCEQMFSKISYFSLLYWIIYDFINLWSYNI